MDYIDSYLQILQSTPSRISQIYESLSNSDMLEYKPAEDEFSFKDIVGHLIHGEEDDWIPRLNLIVAQQDEIPTFLPFDPFGGERLVEKYSLRELVNSFIRKRAESLDTLKHMAITGDMVEMQAIHPALGRVNLGWLLNCWVAHDLSHLNQINRVIVSKFSKVGPWKGYLRIIKDLNS